MCTCMCAHECMPANKNEHASHEKLMKGFICSVKNFNFFLKAMETQRKIFQEFYSGKTEAATALRD